MDHQDVILQELERRLALDAAIDAALDHLFTVDGRGRIRRGRLQAMVAGALGVPASKQLGVVVKRRLEARGIRETAVRGSWFYAGLRPKESVS